MGGHELLDGGNLPFELCYGASEYGAKSCCLQGDSVANQSVDVQARPARLLPSLAPRRRFPAGHFFQPSSESTQRC
jgi:hypothetical protein